MKKFLYFIFLVAAFILIIPRAQAEEPAVDRIVKAFSYFQTIDPKDSETWDVSLNDWLILALSAYGYNPATFKMKDQIITQYQLTTEDDDNLIEAGSLSRHIMAIINSNDDNLKEILPELLQKFDAYFDGIQYGDPQRLNDDIFAIFTLSTIKTEDYQEKIKDLAYYIVSKQCVDGGFSFEVGSCFTSADITAVAIQALINYQEIQTTPDTFIKNKIDLAKGYLKVMQNNDGGFGYSELSDADTTSWVLQSIYALKEQLSDWIIEDKNPELFLLSTQTGNGLFFNYSANTYTTLDALLGLSKKYYPIIPPQNPKDFTTEKPKEEKTKEPEKQLEDSNKNTDQIITTQVINSSITTDIIEEDNTIIAYKSEPFIAVAAIKPEQQLEQQITSPQNIEIAQTAKDQKKPIIANQQKQTRSYRNIYLYIFIISAVLLALQVLKNNVNKKGVEQK